MAATPFKPISWQPNDLITATRLDIMSNNSQWLLENSVRGVYNAHGIRRGNGLKMAAGLTLITSRKQHYAHKDVRFNNFFASNARPIVTTGTQSTAQRRIFVTYDGLGKPYPDHRGFQVHVHIEADSNKNRKISRNFYVSWHALGY